MHFTQKLTASLFTAFILVAGIARSAEVEPRKVTVQFGCVSFVDDHRMVEVPVAAGKWKEVPLSIRYLTAASDAVVAGNVLSLYPPGETPTPEAPGKPLAKVKIPAAGERFLILLLPSATAEQAYRGIAIPAADFRFGGFCMLNTYPEPIMLLIGEKTKHLIKQSEPLIIAPRMMDQGEVASVMFVKPNAKKPFYSAKWNLRPDVREIHIIYEDPTTKRERLKTIVDVKPPPPKETGSGANAR